MIRLCHDYVDTKFIACFLELYQLSIDQVQLRNNGRIGNPLLLEVVEKVYLQFMRSDRNYDKWFDRQIIECTVNYKNLTNSKEGLLVNTG